MFKHELPPPYFSQHFETNLPESMGPIRLSTFVLWFFSLVIVFLCIILGLFLYINNAQTNSQYDIDELQKRLFTLETKLATFDSNLIPIGFVYVQFANQSEPTAIWPNAKWTDVTFLYDGLFIRAGGNGAAPFGDKQTENSPRLIQIEATWNHFKNYRNQLDLPVGEWSYPIFTGNNGKGYKDGLRFHTSGGEVRPRNMAIRIWKRI